VMRVLLIVLGLPAGLALFGSTVEPVVSTRGATEPSLVELAILLTASGLSALAMLCIRFPGGLLFGAMAGSAFLHGTGLIHVSLPWWARRGAHAGRGRRRKVRKYEPQNTAELSGGGLWLVCGRRRGCCVVRSGRRSAASVSNRRRDCCFRAGRAGHDDGARSRDAPRSRLCRGAPSRAVPGCQFFGRCGGAAPRQPRAH